LSQRAPEREKYLGQNAKLLSRNVVFLDRFSNNAFRLSVTVDIRSIPCLDTSIVRELEVGELGDERARRGREGGRGRR